MCVWVCKYIIIIFIKLLCKQLLNYYIVPDWLFVLFKDWRWSLFRPFHLHRKSFKRCFNEKTVKTLKEKKILSIYNAKRLNCKNNQIQIQIYWKVGTLLWSNILTKQLCTENKEGLFTVCAKCKHTSRDVGEKYHNTMWTVFLNKTILRNSTFVNLIICLLSIIRNFLIGYFGPVRCQPGSAYVGLGIQ